MTTPNVSSTYLEFGSFPSEPENQFKSVRGHVSVEVDEIWNVVDGKFQIAYNGVLLTIPMVADLDDDAAVDDCRADLEHLKKHFDGFYEALSSALDGR